MAKLKSLTFVARRPWYAWLELQYRLADEVITHTLGFGSKRLEEVPPDICDHSHRKLYEVVKFFYNQMECESGSDLTDKPLFAIAAGHNLGLDHILGCVGGSFYGEQNISQEIWHRDLAAVMLAITSARKWFLRHDRESETADSKRGKAVKAGAKAGGKRRRISDKNKLQIARLYDSDFNRIMKQNPSLKRTAAAEKVGDKHGRSGRHVREYLKRLHKE